MRLIDRLWTWPDGLVWRLTRGFTERSRRDRFLLMMKRLQLGPHTRVVDVGVGDGEGRAINFFENWYPWKSQITAVSLESDLPNLRKQAPGVRHVQGDGRRLPFPSGAFDVAVSTAVLEHVGTQQDQQRFVHELCRVAPVVFLSTPNRWFPVDSHTMIPFAHWLPMRVRNAVYRVCGRSFYASEERLHLLSKREIRACVPSGWRVRFYPQRTCGMVTVWNVILTRHHV